MSTAREIRNARAMSAGQARWDAMTPDDDDDSPLLTEEEAMSLATDERMADGYSLAWAIQSICLGEPEGVVGFDALYGSAWTPDCSVQQLLAVVISGNVENSRMAVLELRERIHGCAAMQHQIKDRADELIREQERVLDGAREEYEMEQSQ